MLKKTAHKSSTNYSSWNRFDDALNYLVISYSPITKELLYHGFTELYVYLCLSNVSYLYDCVFILLYCSGCTGELLAAALTHPHL